LKIGEERADFESRSYEIQVDETQEIESSENNVVFRRFIIRYESGCEVCTIRKTIRRKHTITGYLI
jgi:hypothetical protein